MKLRSLGLWLLVGLTAACESIEPVPPKEGEVLAQQGECEVVVPSATFPQAHAVRLCQEMQVLYLNFEGQTTIGASYDDPVTGRSSVVAYTRGVGKVATVAPFSGAPEQRANVLERVRAHFAGQSIDVVDIRPADPLYSMVVVGGYPSDINGPGGRRLAGIAPLDCDNDTPLGIGYVFAEDIGPDDVDQIAQSIAHEAGHMFGLLHVVRKDDNMYKSVVADPRTQSFLHETLEVDGISEGRCNGRTTQSSAMHLTTALPICQGLKQDTTAKNLPALTGETSGGSADENPQGQSSCAFWPYRGGHANSAWLTPLALAALLFFRRKRYKPPQ